MCVKWIGPVVASGVARWEFKCEAQIVTDEAKRWRVNHHLGTACGLSAKVDFDGAKLCVRHASARALQKLLSETETGDRNG